VGWLGRDGHRLGPHRVDRVVGERVGVSRVTARRYLEHLAEQRLAARSPRYGGAGRPEYHDAWISSL
jgi:response regulator of citrate/malate metabolism